MDTNKFADDLVKAYQQEIAEKVMKSTVLSRTSDKLQLLKDLGVELLPAHTFVLVDVTFTHPYLNDEQKKNQVQNRLNQVGSAGDVVSTKVIGVSPDGGFQVGNG